MNPRFFGSCFVVALLAAPTFGQAIDTRASLYELELVNYDLQQASRMMTIFDRDESGAVEKEEQTRLNWKSEIPDFDLNRDGKLTHLEFAVREAKLRSDNDVTAFDINNVTKFLGRHDSNRNGQLEPDEIESGGWPSNPSDYDANGDGILTTRELSIRFAFNRGLRREMGIEAIDQTGAMAIVRRFDKDGDKKLAPDEYDKAPLPKPAKTFDENNDGLLEIIELSTMLAKHRRDAGLTKPDVTKIRNLFSRFDLNGDGMITATETSSFTFADVRRTSTGDATAERTEPTTNENHPILSYDTDKDGDVTITEVEKIVAASRKEKGYIEVDFQKAKSSLRRHDSNNSRFIEEHELFDQPKVGQLSKRIFRSTDRNDDGRIDIDELSRHFAARRQRSGK